MLIGRGQKISVFYENQLSRWKNIEDLEVGDFIMAITTTGLKRSPVKRIIPHEEHLEVLAGDTPPKMSPGSFFRNLKAGKVSVQEVCDFVDYYHTHPEIDCKLIKFLGMTWKQFGEWIIEDSLKRLTGGNNARKST